MSILQRYVIYPTPASSISVNTPTYLRFNSAICIQFPYVILIQAISKKTQSSGSMAFLAHPTPKVDYTKCFFDFFFKPPVFICFVLRPQIQMDF